MRKARLDLDAHPSSARAVRSLVSEFCAGLDGVDDVDGVLLAASELVTNALLHGKPPLSLELTANRSTLRVAIFDGGDENVAPRGELVADATSGRGLAIVEVLSSRWAVERTAGRGGKVVWFEIDLVPA